MPDLPKPVTTDQEFMAAMCARLDAQNSLLGEIRDRLGQANDETPPAAGSGPRPVELREPEPPGKAELAEPASPEPAAEQPKPAPKKRATKSTRSR